MIAKGLLPAPQFSFWLDVQTEIDSTAPIPNSGELVFGGSNPARYTGTHTM
jgi:hypothetical protein